MTKSKKKRTRDDESQAGRTAKMTKSNKKRTRDDDEQEGEEEGGSIILRHEFIAHRLEGGAPATPEAYARAIEQWQQLPGAIASRTQISPTSIRSNTAVPNPTIDTE
jgi:hypothetical protein